MEQVADFLGLFDLLLSRYPIRLFEINDQPWWPSILRQRIQSALYSQWINKFPLLQRQSPAELAARILQEQLESSDFDNKQLTVIDFCAGGGGPTPIIERIINTDRRRRGERPIDFVLSDLNPHLDAWIPLAEESGNLRFIAQSVDAANPPDSAIGQSDQQKKLNGDSGNGNNSVFRVFFLAFHHFDDDTAQKILESTMKTSDGFAIVELVERRISSMFVNIEVLIPLIITPLLYFLDDPIMLFFTYIFPLLPLVIMFDGIVSALRIRTFEEVMFLVDKAVYGGTSQSMESIGLLARDRNHLHVTKKHGWIFEGGRALHTFPHGHMNWVVGRRSGNGQK